MPAAFGPDVREFPVSNAAVVATGDIKAAWEATPRLGWVVQAAPVQALSNVAEQLGLASLHIKRDDSLDMLGGGTKVRKLDYLLARRPFSAADSWVGIGGIGSGQLVALSSAAALLHKRLIAHCFVQPLSRGVIDNLALTASGPSTLLPHRSRVSMALRHPALFLSDTWHGAPVVPPGATCAVGMLGMLRAAFELAEQIARGELPAPDVIYLAFGSGGTAVGLAYGLALSGIKARIVAVSAVERPFATRRRIAHLVRALRGELLQAGMQAWAQVEPLPVLLDRRQLGRGYAHPTVASQAACARLSPAGVHLEPVYTGKAMAALFADVPSLGGKHVLFWNTRRAHGSAPAASWRERLPKSLSCALALAMPDGEAPKSRTRRRLLTAGATVAAGALVAGRVGFYPRLDGWHGRVLSSREASILAAAAAAMLPFDEATPTPLEVAANVDRYLVGMPETQLADVHKLFILVEHGTLLGGSLLRLTRLRASARDAFLRSLASSGGLLAQAYRGVRDLCMVGYYQDPRTWGPLGYTGPWAVPGKPAVHGVLEGLSAPNGVLPRGVAP